MATLSDQLQQMSTTDTAPNLDTLPEDILQLIITQLQLDLPEKPRNVPLYGVEKDAQDNVFQRSPWNKDLDSLALVCRRLREEAFWKVRMRVLRVKDTEADLRKTVKVVREPKRHHVHAIIFGNGRITEGVAKSPDYQSFCSSFSELRAIRHTSSYDFYAVEHIPNPVFTFHTLNSLDVHLPSALLESTTAPTTKKVQPISVHSLTLRSYDEFMLHLPGPFTTSPAEWLHNVVRQVKDVRQLNLHTGLEDDADKDYPGYNKLPKYEPFPGFWKEDFVGLEELNIYFETRYRKDAGNPCDLQLWTHLLTHFVPTIRHVRFFIQYPDIDEISETIQQLRPNDLPADRDLTGAISRYFPTLEQIEVMVEKAAQAIPALQTFEVKVDDRRAHPPPLIHYSATIQRDELGGAKTRTNIVKHIRTVDGETMSWLVESVAELLGLGGMMDGYGGDGRGGEGWSDEFDELDEGGDDFDDFYDHAADEGF
ncbi:hypothetical protein QFC22_006503 [Naganishia vaughanmartiniae]|uniref:Uncharacterized protein n=1 Tax=Naganishia vaughanmartiniae TaxID=1424756 RepID=A0ACC2WKX7_9TREE|nr:hypothetical protein QFC22_006503 [Naganishia vaughanmartiniae]